MIKTNLENWSHRQRVVERKRQIDLQRLDNEIDEMLVDLPKYSEVKLKRTAGTWNLFRQILP